LRIWPAPATMPACNPRDKTDGHRFRLAAMTTIALERGRFSPWRPLVAAAMPVDTAIVPMADLTEQALFCSCRTRTCTLRIGSRSAAVHAGTQGAVLAGQVG
jgi:hypothetical protein